MDIARDMCEIAHRVRVCVGLRRVIQQLIYTGGVCLAPFDELVERGFNIHCTIECALCGLWHCIVRHFRLCWTSRQYVVSGKNNKYCRHSWQRLNRSITSVVG